MIFDNKSIQKNEDSSNKGDKLLEIFGINKEIKVKDLFE